MNIYMGKQSEEGRAPGNEGGRKPGGQDKLASGLAARTRSLGAQWSAKRLILPMEVISTGLLGLVAHCHATAGSKAAHGGFPGSESTVRRRAVWRSISRRASSRLTSANPSSASTLRTVGMVTDCYSIAPPESCSVMSDLGLDAHADHCSFVDSRSRSQERHMTSPRCMLCRT
jgi:hypothetical protein